MAMDIKGRWQRLKKGEQAGIVIMSVLIIVLTLAVLGREAPAPADDSKTGAKIAAMEAQTAALNAETAALNKLTDDLKSKKSSWTISAKTDPKWPFTVPHRSYQM